MVNICHVGLCIAQVCTFVAYAVVTAGAALLQQKANTLSLFKGLNEADLVETRKVYVDVFQSTTYIIPYPQRPQYQFQYQWFIIEFEFAVFALTAILTIFPSLIPRMRSVALAFLSTALVLVLDNVNALFFLLRSELAVTVFDGYRIETAQAGLMMVGIANCMTIIFLGAYQPTYPETDARDVEIPTKAATKA